MDYTEDNYHPDGRRGIRARADDGDQEGRDYQYHDGRRDLWILEALQEPPGYIPPPPLCLWKS